MRAYRKPRRQRWNSGAYAPFRGGSREKGDSYRIKNANQEENENQKTIYGVIDRDSGDNFRADGIIRFRHADGKSFRRIVACGNYARYGELCDEQF